jgi:hypothetical protein
LFRVPTVPSRAIAVARNLQRTGTKAGAAAHGSTHGGLRANRFPQNWYDFMDPMEKANRNGECDEIERFARSSGKNPHCIYNFETNDHTLQLSGQSIVITREDFDDRKWQKKIRQAIQPRPSR